VNPSRRLLERYAWRSKITTILQILRKADLPLLSCRHTEQIWEKTLFFLMSLSSPIRLHILLLTFLIYGSQQAIGQEVKTKFETVSSKKSYVKFKNQLVEDSKNNILRYEYFFNGGGVAVGDLDNDGLDDIFFTGNMTPNKLYRNLGGLKFEDVTKSAGVAGKTTWTTGVSMADVNGDGLLDIYVCYSGKGAPEGRKNELWINLGNFKFVDKAEELGIADPSNSTQGLFFDFDRDGDLDLFLLNHHIQVINTVEFDAARSERHPFAGDKLYENVDGKFHDISDKAGIHGHPLGFGLGVVASDINQDGWPDLLVTNDYIEKDYLYINNGDGTFTDRMVENFEHISHFSMGADIADINDDGLPDVFTLDMLPEDNERQKLLYGPENYEQYALMLKQGFHHQNMRNMLQINQGEGAFSEVGQLAGISNTDWSWSALFFDANNDGAKDLFVTNGYFRDYTNRDFLKYKGDYYFKQAIAGQKADTLHLVTSMTSTPVRDYFFENQGELRFANRSVESGFTSKSFSAGAAYSDLDNDGDLDLVVSYLNEIAGIFENKAENNSWVQVELRENSANRFAIGATVMVFSAGSIQKLELNPTRGFQSSSTYRLHFGLGPTQKLDSIQVIWPDQSIQTLLGPAINQILAIEKSAGLPKFSAAEKKKPLLSKLPSAPDFVAGGIAFNDFKRQPLMVTMPSHLGPVMAKADLDGDGIDELFMGGSKGSPAKIYTYMNQDWTPYRGFRSASDFTDAVALFEDFNRDGKMDLFVGSGGYHDYLSSDPALRDRLFLNDGNGILVPQSDFPINGVSTGAAVTLDVNGDGFPDLFVGGRLIPGRYPETPSSMLLLNDGKGGFTPAIDGLPNDGNIGMITAAVIQDLNGDGIDDLILVGEYMSPKALINQAGRFEDRSSLYFPDNTSGWWNTLVQADIDGDGDLDLIAGNLGHNSQLMASPDAPLRLYAADFDQNGSIDPILECFIADAYYPFASRDELLDQMVSMRSKFTDYASYAKAKLSDMFSPEDLAKAQLLEANTLESTYFENTGSGFKAHTLPRIAQSFPVYAIMVKDVNDDEKLDLILGGNQSQNRIRIGKIDAGLGLVLLGDGTGNFTPLSASESGLRIKGDIKSMVNLSANDGEIIVFGINQQKAEVYQLP
jgi:hypothetical protein